MLKQAMTELCTRWKPSRYNWIVPVEEYGGGGAIFNAFTGACLDFDPVDFERVRRTLVDAHEKDVDFRLLGANAASLGGALIAGGFLVQAEFDELLALENGSANRAEGLPLVLTINPTFACNLGCSYCFVGKKQGLMDENTEQQLIKFVEDQLRPSDVPALVVDWFGGEPLLAKRTLGRLSEAFLRLCNEKSIPYSAQVITNATLITAELAKHLSSWGSRDTSDHLRWEPRHTRCSPTVERAVNNTILVRRYDARPRGCHRQVRYSASGECRRWQHR
ncbi:radical SAM protein [Gilvimarinus sp. F26214L]|uniref:radical SAM protein n=1 Tax=Gilvimarinus sp. DZF01 TaxID=3461371 RepID=UPI0040465C3F